MGLAAMHLMSRRASMKDFKLATVAAVLGLDVDDGKMHNARYDVVLMRQMFEYLKNGQGGTEST
jgi:DNA polymerase III subunit epsilon